MKIALVNPGINQYNDSPPLNLALIASCLERDGYEVSIIDKLSGDNYEDKLNKFNPDVIGITGTTPVITDAYRCADIARKLGILTIMGGVHSSILPKESLKHSDVVVIGEGESTIKDVLENNLRGIVKGKPTMDLNTLPLPAYRLLNMDFYTSLLQRVDMSFAAIAPKHYKIGCILTSRGCPYDCTFCHNSYSGLPFRFNSPENVIKEIQLLIDNYHVRAIFFIEDNLFVHQKRVKKICELLKKEGIDIVWGANSRVDNINEEILKIAKSAGCRNVTFGWESGSQRILDILNKRTTVELNYKSVELCNKVGLNAGGTVMLGNPTETIEDIKLTQKFISDSNITSGIGVCIHPNTKILSELSLKSLNKCNTTYSKNGNINNIKKKFSRNYKGYLIGINPYCFNKVFLTPNHLVLIIEQDRWRNKGYNKKRKFSVDKICPVWKEADTLKKYDLLLIPKIKTFVQDVKSISGDLAELFGWYLAEGYLDCKEDKDYGRVIITQKKKRNDLLNLLERLHFSYNIQKADIRIHKSSRLLKTIKTLFGNCRAPHKFIPDIIKHLPKNKVSRFLLGYWKGDGYKEYFTTSSVELAYDIQSLLLRFDILCSITRCINEESVYKGNVLPRRKYFELKIKTPCVNKFYKLIGVKLRRKSIHKYYLENKDYFFIPIHEISRIKYSGKVLNCETEDETFTVPFIIHNCITTPYPGTKLWEWCKKEGRIPSTFRWEDFDFHHIPIRVTDIPDEVFMGLFQETVEIAIKKYYKHKREDKGWIYE